MDRNIKRYADICAPNHPDSFIIAGLGTTVTAGSFFRVMYWKIKYIVQWYETIAADDIKNECVKQDVAGECVAQDVVDECGEQDAMDEYDVWTNEFFQQVVFVDGCRSWYTDH